VSRAEKVWRWCRRKPALASSLAALLLVLLAGAGGVLWQWRRAESAALVTRKNLYAADMELAFRAFAANDGGYTRQLLEKYLPHSIHADRAGTDLRGWEWRYLWQESRSRELRTLMKHPAAVMG